MRFNIKKLPRRYRASSDLDKGSIRGARMEARFEG